MMRIGIFGGTFDPPHFGHLILAAESLYWLNLDRVLWVLTPYPPHKQGQLILPVPYRLEMVLAAIAGNPAFELSQIDLERQPPLYSVDTVRLLSAEYPGAEMVYLIGGDSLHDLPTWHAPNELVAVCDEIGVMRRPEDQIELVALEEKIPGISAKIRFVEAPLLQISSSEIRQRVRDGEPFRYYVPQSVYEIIVKNRLYGKVIGDQ